MKRVILFLALASTFALSAQTNKEVERAAFVRDSVKNVLSAYRDNYDKNEAEREKLTPIILKLEEDVVQLQAEYEKALAAVSSRDVQVTLMAYEQMRQEMERTMNQEQVVEDDKGKIYIPHIERMKRNLVYNDFFVERLSRSDYNSLCAAQEHEIFIKGLVDSYVAKYNELIELQKQYMEIPTKEEADEIAERFAAKEEEMQHVDRDIASAWSVLYYNKMYAYDLLMERYGSTAMLNLSAEVSANAEREMQSANNRYQSNALVAYMARKKALAAYEAEIASTLQLTPSRDSLNVVIAELKNVDYKMAKLSLPRRSFIVYEDISVKLPSIYNYYNPIPRVKVYDYGVVYSIQIALFTGTPRISVLRGVNPLWVSDTTTPGMNTCYAGTYRTEAEAQVAVEYLKKLGFRDPIISVWVDGMFYRTVEEMRKSENLYTLEISGVASLTEEMKACILACNSECTISRRGSTYLAGTFEDKSLLETLVVKLKMLDSNVTVEITKKN